MIEQRLFDSQYNDKGVGIVATSPDEFIIYGHRFHGSPTYETDTWLVKFSFLLTTGDENLLPDEFALHQNYPNPFNPTTQIKYDLPEDALVNITIYDMMGRSIMSLVNSHQSAGYRSVQWNATNNLGEPVSAGMYLYTIQAGEFWQTKKMVLLK